jgi:hypothetical protein
MAMLVRGAVAAAAAVGVSSTTTTKVHQSQSTGVLACRGSAFCRGASANVSWAGCQVRERRAAGALRVTNVAAPVKEQEVIEVGFSPYTSEFTICYVMFSLNAVPTCEFMVRLCLEQNVASKENARPVFPFTAIVGQEEMKMCLILNVIDPKIGGVMIMGDRGTGKSTTVRALVDLLPEIEVVAGDPFNSSPNDPELMSEEVRKRVQAKEQLSVAISRINMVDLPLGATEDRVCGTIDIEKALTEGVKAFEPGLLAKANRGILYVDEVNLLDDHLVDVLLDSAASGWNTVEREGISISHPARFILIGSGNPEEGELRPQLLDRFGMHAQV